ncbi:hypothetical protein MRX96_035885, partial [Rhipicephalus microplus]
MMVDGQTRRRTPSAEGPPRATAGVGGVGSSSCSDSAADHEFGLQGAELALGFRLATSTSRTGTTGSDSATSPAADSRPRFFSKPNCERLLLGVINPDENALFVWLWILTWCVLYNAWALILRQTFTELQTSSVHLWFVADSFADLVYLLDIVVQFRTGYLEQGLMVCEARKLAGHYVRSKPFLMDLLALTPLDLLQFQIGIAPLLRFPLASSRGRMQGGGDINSALGCLPDKLKTELALHVNLKTLKK